MKLTTTGVVGGSTGLDLLDVSALRHAKTTSAEKKKDDPVQFTGSAAEQKVLT